MEERRAIERLKRGDPEARGTGETPPSPGSTDGVPDRTGKDARRGRRAGEHLVRSAPTVEVDEKVEKNGVGMTLERVVNSPARPQVVICIEPPDDVHEELYPMVEPYPADNETIEPLPLGNG